MISVNRELANRGSIHCIYDKARVYNYIKKCGGYFTQVSPLAIYSMQLKLGILFKVVNRCSGITQARWVQWVSGQVQYLYTIYRVSEKRAIV